MTVQLHQGRWRAALWLAVLVSLGALVAWRANVWSPSSQDQGNAPSDQTASNFADSPTLTMYRPGDRRQAPALEGNTLGGTNLSLADLTGHIVILNVWGSWCIPCREEAPVLARIARQTASRAVRFVGIDTRDTLAAARAFVRNLAIPYPSIVDTDGQKLLAFNGIIPMTAIPSTLVIDSEGRIAARIIGRVTYSTLHGLIDDELANQGTQ